MIEVKKEDLLLGLDVSTKTIGVALFKMDGTPLELTHIAPKAKPVPETKIEELMIKANHFSEFSSKYLGMGVKYVVIEEPLLRSNNVNTVGTLLRFNGMVSKIIYDKFGIVPTYISTYESRKNAFPELMQPNKDGKIVLFGGLPKDIDKKDIIWKKVAALEPQITWEKDKKGKMKNEMYDVSDAYCCARAFLKMNDHIK